MPNTTNKSIGWEKPQQRSSNKSGGFYSINGLE